MVTHYKAFDAILYKILTGKRDNDEVIRWAQDPQRGGIFPPYTQGGGVYTDYNRYSDVDPRRIHWIVEERDILNFIRRITNAKTNLITIACKNLHLYIDKISIEHYGENNYNIEIKISPEYILYLFNGISFKTINKIKSKNTNFQYIFIGRRSTGKTSLAKRFCEICQPGDNQTRRILCNQRNLPWTDSVDTWRFNLNENISIVIQDTMGITSSKHAEQQITFSIQDLNIKHPVIVIFVWAIDDKAKDKINENVLRDVVRYSVKYLKDVENLYQNKIFFILNKGDLINDEERKEIIEKYEEIIRDLFKDYNLGYEIIWWGNNEEKKPFILYPPEERGKYPPEERGKTPKNDIKNYFIDKFGEVVIEEEVFKVNIDILSQGFNNFIDFITKELHTFSSKGEKEHQKYVLEEIERVRNIWREIYGKYREERLSKKYALRSMIFLTYYIKIRLIQYLEGKWYSDENLREYCKDIENQNNSWCRFLNLCGYISNNIDKIEILYDREFLSKIKDISNEIYREFENICKEWREKSKDKKREERRKLLKDIEKRETLPFLAKMFAKSLDRLFKICC